MTLSSTHRDVYKRQVVGGMPECVMQFAETKDYILVRHTQDTILASYLNDMSKYNNLNEIKKTRLAYDNITVQLSKKNTRFQYKLIKKGGLSLIHISTPELLVSIIKSKKIILVGDQNQLPAYADQELSPIIAKLTKEPKYRPVSYTHLVMISSSNPNRASYIL